MSTITLQQAQASLPEMVHSLAPGERITITENDQPVAYLVVPYRFAQKSQRQRPPVTGIPKAGRWKGLLVVPEDYDEPLEELREYME